MKQRIGPYELWENLVVQCCQTSWKLSRTHGYLLALTSDLATSNLPFIPLTLGRQF